MFITVIISIQRRLMMSDKEYTIRKYNYIPNLGYPYLIADVINNKNEKIIIFHQLLVDYETIEDETFNYRACQYNVSNPYFNEVGTKTIVQNLFDRHRGIINNEIKNNRELDETLTPITEIGSGEKTITELQYTQRFDEIKEKITGTKMSGSLRKFFKGLDHMPIKAGGWKWQ